MAAYSFMGLLLVIALTISLSQSVHRERIDRCLFWVFGFVLVAFAVLRPIGLARDDLAYVEILKAFCPASECFKGMPITRDYVWYGLVKLGLPLLPGTLLAALAVSGLGVLIKLFVIDRLCKEKLLALLLLIPLSFVQYDLTQQYLQLLRQFLSPDKSIRFNRVANKLYLDSDRRQLSEGMYLIIEAYRILDPRVYPEVYNDRLLKKYLVALVRWQWGVNLSKYSGIKLPGDITLDGQSMMKDSWTQKEEIEKEIILKGELPVDFIMG